MTNAQKIFLKFWYHNNTIVCELKRLCDSCHILYRVMFVPPPEPREVRLTAASDFIVEALKSLGKDKVSFAYLVTCQMRMPVRWQDYPLVNYHSCHSY